MEKKRSKGILWRILFFLAVVAAAVILELGKHTILGWILAALLFAGYYLIRSRFWRKWKTGRKLLVQAGMLSLTKVSKLVLPASIAAVLKIRSFGLFISYLPP